MAIYASRVKGRNIIGSGVIVGKKDDFIEIYPFRESPDYCVKPKFIPLGTTENASVRLYEENDGIVAIELKQPWIFPNELTVTDSVIASDDQNSYYMSFFVKFVGDMDSFTFSFQYTVTAGPRHG